MLSFVARIERHPPRLAGLHWRQGEPLGLVARIQQQQQCVVADQLAALVNLGDGVTHEHHAEGTHGGRVPPGVGHFLARRVEPQNVGGRSPAGGMTPEEGAPAQHRMRSSQMDELPYKGQQRLLLGGQVPVEPADLVVLAVGVVVATMGAAHLVAGTEHGHALR